jgi:CRP-like cAMP-binding protein
LRRNTPERHANWREFTEDLSTIAELDLPKEADSETQRFNMLKALPFFQDFSEIELWEVLRISIWGRVPSGTYLVDEGTKGNFFFVIADGSVGVVKGNKKLATLGKGHCFGEMCYIRQGALTRTATILADTPVTLFKIKADSLHKASENCQLRFNRSFMNILVDRLAQATSELATVPTEAAPGRRLAADPGVEEGLDLDELLFLALDELDGAIVQAGQHEALLGFRQHDGDVAGEQGAGRLELDRGDLLDGDVLVALAALQQVALEALQQHLDAHLALDHDLLVIDLEAVAGFRLGADQGARRGGIAHLAGRAPVFRHLGVLGQALVAAVRAFARPPPGAGGGRGRLGRRSLCLRRAARTCRRPTPAPWPCSARRRHRLAWHLPRRSETGSCRPKSDPRRSAAAW